MTDREFDNLMKEALSSDSVPEHLNNSLMLALQKKEQRKVKILKFVKACSSCAAVFICAVAVISYYNSDVPSRTENSIPEIKNTVTEKEVEKEETAPKTDETAQKENITTSKKPQPKSDLAENKPLEKAVDVAPTADTSAPVAESAGAIADAAPAKEDAVIPDTPQEESAPFSKMRSIAPTALSDLFNDGYDYKSVISEKISAQIALMDFPEKINFSQITGDENFSLNEENILTIEFAAGTIASEEHGDLFFTVGTVQNGVLE